MQAAFAVADAGGKLSSYEQSESGHGQATVPLDDGTTVPAKSLWKEDAIGAVADDARKGALSPRHASHGLVYQMTAVTCSC